MKDRTYNITEDEHLEITIEGYDQRLKFAVYHQMEFLSEEIGIDDPAVVIREIEDALSDYYLEHALEYEDIDDDSKEKDPNVTSIKEHDKKLKLAVWRHMEFLMNCVGIDDHRVIDVIDESIEKYIREYSPMEELF